MASQSFKSGLKRSALTVALGLCFAGGVHAQSTTGTMVGSATPGDTITVQSETGFTRTVSVGSDGRYAIANLPVGQYTVTAKHGDAVTGTKQALLRVGAGTDVSFASTATSSSGPGTRTTRSVCRLLCSPRVSSVLIAAFWSMSTRRRP